MKTYSGFQALNYYILLDYTAMNKLSHLSVHRWLRIHCTLTVDTCLCCRFLPNRSFTTWKKYGFWHISWVSNLTSFHSIRSVDYGITLIKAKSSHVQWWPWVKMTWFLSVGKASTLGRLLSSLGVVSQKLHLVNRNQDHAWRTQGLIFIYCLEKSVILTFTRN